MKPSGKVKIFSESLTRLSFTAKKSSVARLSPTGKQYMSPLYINPVVSSYVVSVIRILPSTMVESRMNFLMYIFFPDIFNTTELVLSKLFAP